MDLPQLEREIDAIIFRCLALVLLLLLAGPTGLKPDPLDLSSVIRSISSNKPGLQGWPSSWKETANAAAETLHFKSTVFVETLDFIVLA